MVKMNQFTVKLNTDEMWIVLDALEAWAESFEEYADTCESDELATEEEIKESRENADKVKALREKLFHTHNDTK